MKVVYKVIRKFSLEGKMLKNGMYVELDPSTVRLRVRRNCLLMARDQKGARKLLGLDKPIKAQEKDKKPKIDSTKPPVQTKGKNKNAKKNK